MVTSCQRPPFRFRLFPLVTAPSLPITCRFDAAGGAAARAGARPVRVLSEPPSPPPHVEQSSASGRGRRRHGYLVPDPARCVEAVALGLPGGSVRDVGVEGMPVVGGLDGAAGARDRAELAGDAGHGGDGTFERRPQPGALPVAL